MHIAAIAIAGIIALVPVALVWYINIGGVYTAIKDTRANLARKISADLICKLDTDCPPGYTCQNGRCVTTS